jgi:hypothetical protein
MPSFSHKPSPRGSPQEPNNQQLSSQQSQLRIASLIERLTNADLNVRSEAATALGKIGPDAVPALAIALKDPDLCVRYQAAWALGRIGPEAVPALVTALLKDPEQRAPEKFYVVSLKEIATTDDGQFDNIKLLTIKIDKSIPNDVGYLVVPSFGDFQYNVKAYEPKEGEPPSDTQCIVVVLDTEAEKGPKTVEEFTAKLPCAAKVYLAHNRPKPPTTGELHQTA